MNFVTEIILTFLNFNFAQLFSKSFCHFDWRSLERTNIDFSLGYLRHYFKRGIWVKFNFVFWPDIVQFEIISLTMRAVNHILCTCLCSFGHFPYTYSAQVVMATWRDEHFIVIPEAYRALIFENLTFLLGLWKVISTFYLTFLNLWPHSDFIPFS